MVEFTFLTELVSMQKKKSFLSPYSLVQLRNKWAKPKDPYMLNHCSGVAKTCPHGSPPIKCRTFKIAGKYKSGEKFQSDQKCNCSSWGSLWIQRVKEEEAVLLFAMTSGGNGHIDQANAYRFNLNPIHLLIVRKYQPEPNSKVRTSINMSHSSCFCLWQLVGLN